MFAVNEVAGRSDLEKICANYSKVQSKEKQTAEEACIILEHIIDKYIVESGFWAKKSKKRVEKVHF